jgi:hypothetical protein
MDNFIKVIPNIISDEVCDSLIEDFATLPDIDGDIASSRESKNSILGRNDYSIGLNMGHQYDTEESIATKKEYCDLIMPIIAEQTFYYLGDYGQAFPFPLELDSIKMQKSTAAKGGGFHAWHFENEGCQSDDITRRMLVWMVYLNDVPVGEGETEFIYQGIRLQPKRGDLVIWPAGFTHTHRGNPVYTTDKYIITGWQSWPTPDDANAYINKDRAAAVEAHAKKSQEALEV